MKELNEREQGKTSQVYRTWQKARRCLIYWCSCIQAQRLSSWEPRQSDKSTRAQLPAAQYRNWRPSLLQTERLLSKLWYYYLIKQKNFLALTFFPLLNNWPPFCRKTNKQSNPYRQYILERPAVSSPSSSLFQHHIMKSPQYIKKPNLNNKT